MYYRYSQKWVDVFAQHPVMINVETGHYIKGLHTLLNAHFDLRNFAEFDKALQQFEDFEKTPVAQQHDNFRTHTSIYINSAKINGYIMKGQFAEGCKLVPHIEEKLSKYALFVDRHRILVFTYKFAQLYFGKGDYDKAIDYLMQIINGPIDLRIDLQSYARLLHLMAHYELGNYDLMESLVKSVYRFMAKMKNLTVVEEEILKFVKTSFTVNARQLKPELEKLLSKIKHLEKSRFETRAFAYLDVISWLESKVSNKPMSVIIHDKYLKSKRK
jgi:tetratricopeptide (TPR) repeat protein